MYRAVKDYPSRSYQLHGDVPGVFQAKSMAGGITAPPAPGVLYHVVYTCTAHQGSRGAPRAEAPATRSFAGLAATTNSKRCRKRHDPCSACLCRGHKAMPGDGRVCAWTGSCGLCARAAATHACDSPAGVLAACAAWSARVETYILLQVAKPQSLYLRDPSSMAGRCILSNICLRTHVLVQCLARRMCV